MHKRYLDLPWGQVHLREAGPRDGRPILLLHWLPWSGAQYEPVAPHLVARGWRVLAPDHMGYGRSDPFPGVTRTEDLASVLAALIEAEIGGPAVIAGGHHSAMVGADLAVRRPELVAALIVDGSPAWDPVTREKILEMVRDLPPPPDEAASHLIWAWKKLLFVRRVWNADLAVDADTAESLRHWMIDYLATGLDPRNQVLLSYDLPPTLRALTVPTLALTADRDPLVSEHGKVLSWVPGVIGHAFAGVHPLHVPARAWEWADVVDRFARGQFAAADGRAPLVPQDGGYT